MRYIDIDSLEIPDGWQIRADQALERLRQEVSEAEANAIAIGADPVLARKRAISNGLKIHARAQVWQCLNSSLAMLSNGKCWYSESRNPTADKNVDHFRPKNRVEEDSDHEGYWWLAFQWRNYRYASQWTNQRRVND